MLSSPDAIEHPDPVTAGDLIQMLLHYDEDTVVCIPGYEGGVSPIQGIKRQALLKNVNSEYYYGPHDTLDSVDDPDSYQKETFLILTSMRLPPLT